MPRGVKKEHLPTKICVTCERPFTWRKKWERVWDDVTTCSKSCNRKRRMGRQILKSGGDPEPFFEQSLPPSVLNSLDSEVVNEQRTEDDADCSISSNVLEELEALNLEGDSNPDFDKVDEISQQDEEDPVERQKAERKAAKKKKKQERRAQREGRGDPTCGQKQCDMCTKSVDLLIRCTYDETQEWNMVCGKCWHKASGGVVDDGGLWKNRRAQK
eukprot:scaffold44868_cov59-Attheya_sp.AAC.2